MSAIPIAVNVIITYKLPDIFIPFESFNLEMKNKDVGNLEKNFQVN